jgi:hypothetical protein
VLIGNEPSSPVSTLMGGPKTSGNESLISLEQASKSLVGVFRGRFFRPRWGSGCLRLYFATRFRLAAD